VRVCSLVHDVRRVGAGGLVRWSTMCEGSVRVCSLVLGRWLGHCKDEWQRRTTEASDRSAWQRRTTVGDAHGWQGRTTKANCEWRMARDRGWRQRWATEAGDKRVAAKRHAQGHGYMLRAVGKGGSQRRLPKARCQTSIPNLLIPNGGKGWILNFTGPGQDFQENSESKIRNPIHGFHCYSTLFIFILILILPLPSLIFILSYFYFILIVILFNSYFYFHFLSVSWSSFYHHMLFYSNSTVIFIFIFIVMSDFHLLFLISIPHFLLLSFILFI
jgi:hypothetical protein